MTRSPSVLRSALALFRVRFVLQQLGLALLVFAFFVLWLHIPDASGIDVIGSVLLALIVLAIAGAGESALILSLVGAARTSRRLLRGTLLLLAGASLWFAGSALLDHMHSKDFLLAGYLNSRFPHSLRNFFSFERIVVWLGWTWAVLQWIGAGVIALFVFTATASVRRLRAMVCVLRCPTYWIAVVLAMTGAAVLTALLMQWTPGHGLRIEMLSLALRLSAVVLVDAIVACLLLTILAVCVRQTDALYSTPAGMPDESQPRTAGNP